ncbi:MAG: copper chaperone PCu(A)C, partial [Bombella apis]|nr:copper chaperone PCu(A)C [Bombella apis]
EDIIMQYSAFSAAALLLAFQSSIAMAANTPTAPSVKDITVSDTALHTRYKEAPFAFGTFTLTNHSTTDLLLRGISSPSCNSVTSNRNSQVAIQSPNDMDDMFQHMAIPRESTLVFPTSEYHLICHGLKVPYQPGNALSFTFHFQNVGDVTASFTMQPIVEERNVGP